MNNAPTMMHNVTFDELTVGQSACLTRTLTQQDIELFAAVSGDVNPAHMNAQFAEHGFFHGVIGHGMWTGALISTVLGTQLPGPGTIYMDQQLRFSKPVHIGDEVTVTITVKTKHEGKPVVDFDCIGTNDKGETVIEGMATVMAPTEKMTVRPALPGIEVYGTDHYKTILAVCKDMGCIKTAVVHPVQANALEAVVEAVHEGLIDPVLIGQKLAFVKPPLLGACPDGWVVLQDRLAGRRSACAAAPDRPAPRRGPHPRREAQGTADETLCKRAKALIIVRTLHGTPVIKGSHYETMSCRPAKAFIIVKTLHRTSAIKGFYYGNDRLQACYR